MLIDGRGYNMSGNNTGVYIFPDADEFLEFMASLQEAYNEKEGDS